MRTALPAVILAVALGGSSARALEVPPLCKALHGLADEARRTGAPQRIALHEGADGALACRAETSAGVAVCEAAGGDLHAAPWRMDECVKTMAADPQVEVGAAHPGIPHDRLLIHLAAKLGHGVRLDVAARPGGYGVVVWTPN